MGRKAGSASTAAFAVTGLCLATMACEQPTIGERVNGASVSDGPAIVIEDGSLDLHGHAVATFSVTKDDLPLALDEVTALAPRFTLATLTSHPEDGLRAWRSEILNGTTIAKLRPSGPATLDADVLTSVQQPGAETPTSLVELGGGRYRYVFATVLPSFNPDETIRIGAWLDGAPAPTLGTSSTYDFRPSGGPVEARETVLDANCAGCHGLVARHGTRTHVRLCLTCHTWQHADPDTIDPASLASTGTDYANPLELGRLVHRIHRGKRLPTLYRSSSQAVPAPALDAGNDVAAPFCPETSTTAILGKKFSVVGAGGREVVFGKVVQRMDLQQVNTRITATGNTYPRDYRDCDACHAGARQAYEVIYAISRRTCAGCHPDVWFDSTPIADVSHLPHPGGPQPDDSACRGCHVDKTGMTPPRVPIVEAHLPPLKNARFNMPHLEIVKVEGLVPGGQPKVTFKVWDDKAGPLVPGLSNPVPAYDPDPVASSAIPRKLQSLTIRIAGPTFPDYGTGPIADPMSSGGSSGPDPLTLTTNGATDEYVYAFTTTIPLSASGTWAVGLEGRRRLKRAPFDKATNTFQWPYTGETVTESPDNVIAYVDTATGNWPSAGPVPRRRVVSLEKCLRCHLRIEYHGSTRHDPQYCVLCHTPQKTDYSSRPKLSGFVNLPATYDGLEERSLQFKVMIHRLHTGRRKGPSSLEGIQPFVQGSSFREGLFPNDLANCTLCHAGKCYLVENVPAGAAPNIANETASVQHAKSTTAHSPGEPHTPPIQAACLSCHASGPSFAHVAAYTSAGVETCGPCHVKGPLSTEVAHGLARATGTAASTFSSILEQVIVPRCASAACHAAGANPPVLEAAAAYAALVGVQSAEASLNLVEPNAPDASYLVHKLRGTATSVGGSVATIMPPDGALAPADLAAIEAWIANGAPND